jgi:toxin ParE1/3/4
MRLELSRKAQADLDDIRNYSIAQYELKRAIDYLDAVERSFRRLMDFPEIGAAHPGLRPGIRSLGCQRHRIFYVIEERGVLILRILHQAADVERQV